MDIYVALRDSDLPQSFVIGAFSTEANAQSACQAEADDIAEGWGKPSVPLEWKDCEASVINGDKFAVVLVDLDTPVG